MFFTCLFSSYLLGTAYGKTLRRYHGWVVRGVFAVSVWFPLVYRLFICSFFHPFFRACVSFVRSLGLSFVVFLFAYVLVLSGALSCVRLFVRYLFVLSGALSSVRLFVRYLFVLSGALSFVRSGFRLFVCLCARAIGCSFVRSFVRSELIGQVCQCFNISLVLSSLTISIFTNSNQS